LYLTNGHGELNPYGRKSTGRGDIELVVIFSNLTGSHPVVSMLLHGPPTLVRGSMMIHPLTITVMKVVY